MNIDIEEIKASAKAGTPLSANAALALVERLERAEATMNAPRLAGLELNDKMASIGLEGAACQAIAEAFAEQFRRAEATNYIEMHFEHSDAEIGPLFVTLQRVNGKTPHQLRAEAEASKPLIRNAALEDAARLADEEGAMTTRGPLAGFIRAMKAPQFEPLRGDSSTYGGINVR
ncbi:MULTISPECIES: hypothetical protein [Achromobacter]|uniref:hypothetical protein n=1 Tax=Achromobacter TaxID=222 RepID=UPI0023F776F8|nr:hypothetical protein [Achromobacter anxifer]MDF8363312.1 hypothetical protein [Achromobacter anxifer]